MATLTSSHVFDNSSLTNFKDWSMAISNALSTFGWVLTSDTGQVNWSTISTVPVSAAYVYEIWKSTDTLSTALPIVIKLEYGSNGTGATAVPLLRLTIGTASSGAGVITGGSTASQLIGFATAEGATTFPCFFSGDAGEFRMYMWQHPTILVGMYMVIERSKDGTGADTGEYVTWFAGLNSTSSPNGFQQSILPGGIVTIKGTQIHTITIDTASATGTFNGTTASFPVFPLIGKVGNPALGLQTAYNADVADGSTCTVASFYGSTHTYIGLAGSNFTYGINGLGTGVARAALLMRYE